MQKTKSLLLLFILINAIFVKAQVRISVADFGILPNTHQDARPYLQKAIDVCKNHQNTVLYFPKGRYDFYPQDGIENKIDIMQRQATIGLSLRKLKNLTLDGGGSEFIFHGKMQIAEVDSCTNITLRNFSVDWDHPFISQGEIIGSTDNYLDVKIDKKEYPYVVEDGKALFIGEGWKLPIITMYSTLYDKKTKEIVYNTWDKSLGDIFEQKTEELQDGILRFYGVLKMKPENGTMVSLFHVRYFAQGIVVNHSKNVILKDIILYHSLSNGFSANRTENVTMDNASVKMNDAKGRYFSSVADASHFCECKGKIKVINCAHTGQGDDFINVHGINVKILKIINDHSLEVASSGRGNGESITVGDAYWFIDKNTAQRGEVRIVNSKKNIYIDNKCIGFELSFAKKLPKNVNEGDFMECKTWTAGLELRNCRILKLHRARGILVTTPKNVIIENNYFSTAGTAILIDGDLNYWYESGATKNIRIRNNVFDNCLTSGNKNGTRAEWGEAVISITPSHSPQTVDTEPYHHNINISNNIFKVFDAPLVRAVSTRGLRFTNNEIIKTYDYKPYTWQKSAFLLDGCRDVEISGNKIDDKYKTRDIQIEHMKFSDVKANKNEKYIIKPINNIDTHMQW